MTFPTPPLDPTTQAFVDAGAGNPPIYTLSIPDARAFLENAQASTNPSLDSVDYETFDIPVGPTGSVNIHIYKPKGSKGLVPAVVYLHGGGWILGSPITHRRLVLDLIKESGAGVFFIYYTPSPEAQYPVPIEQAYAAVQWLYANGEAHGFDSKKVAFAGDSAGGALAAAVNLLSLERHTPLPLYNVFFYPVADISRQSRTYTLFAEGPGLLRATILWMIGEWAPDVSRRTEILASPLLATKAELEGFPESLVIVAEVDPLREEGEQFARHLAAAGTNTTVFRAEGTIHDFAMLNGLSTTPAARGAIEIAGLKLKRALF